MTVCLEVSNPDPLLVSGWREVSGLITSAKVFLKLKGFLFPPSMSLARLKVVNYILIFIIVGIRQIRFLHEYFSSFLSYSATFLTSLNP